MALAPHRFLLAATSRFPSLIFTTLLVFCLCWESAVAQEEALTETEIIERTTSPEPPHGHSGSDTSGYILPSGSAMRPSDNVEIAERPEDTLFILELVVDDSTVLDPGMLVYILEDDLLIPLSSLTEAMMFPIKVDTSKGIATGWFISEDNTFELAYPFNSVEIAGVKQPIKGTVENHIEDIYVSMSELEKWFPIELTMNFNELRLYMEALEDLPFQSLAARRSRWERAKSQSTTSRIDLNDPDIIFLPYKMYAAPNIQVQHNASHSRTGSTNTTSATTSVQTQGDLLGMLSRFNASTSYRSQEGSLELGNTYFNLSKQDFRGGLAGPFNATEYELGDITATAFPLATGLQRGRGAYITNAPSNYIRNPNEFFIEGFAPEGWDAEIYLNERLLDFQAVGLDGRYLFEDLQLREGFNLFRIVLYGPNGEQEERFERAYLGRNMIDPGQFVYEVSVLQSSTPFFNALSTTPAPTTDPTLSLYGEYGISDRLSVHAGYFTGPDNVSTLNAFGTGARFSTDRAFYQLNVLSDKSGAYSVSGDVTGNVTDTITMNAGHTEHRGFAPNQRNIARRSFVRFNKPFSVRGLVDYGAITVGAEREENENGVVTNKLTNILSGNIAGFSITNDIEYEMRGTQERLRGDLTLRRRTNIGTVRARLNYEFLEAFEANSAELLYQTQLNRETFLNFLVNTSFTGSRETTLTGSINRRFDKFVLSANASVTNEGDARFGLGLNYSFIPTSLHGDYIMTGNPSETSMGQLQLNTFLDVNGDGIFNEGEPPVEGVELRNMQRGTRSTTNDEGHTILGGLTPNLVNRIILNPQSIPSIYLTPAVEQLKVYGKTGINGPVDFPLVLLGEISGMLYTTDATAEDPTNRIQPLTGQEIFLLDEQENVVAQTHSEYDGFYILPSLRMGTYQIYLPPSAELAAHHRGKGLGPVITLSQDKTEAFDTDIVVMPDRIALRDNVDTPTDIPHEIAPQTQVAQAVPVQPVEEAKIAESRPAQRILPQDETPMEDPYKKPADDTPVVIETEDGETVTAVREPVTPKVKPEPAPRTPPVDYTKPLFVQVGLYCEELNAQRHYETLIIAGYNARLEPRALNGKNCYALKVGPDEEMTVEMLKIYIEALGYPAPFISN